MNSKIIFFALMVAAVALEAAADILFKHWAKDARSALLIAGLALYFVGTIFWAYSLKYELLSRAITVFTVANLLAITLVGFLYFHEQLTTTNKLGIALGVISVLLLEW